MNLEVGCYALHDEVDLLLFTCFFLTRLNVHDQRDRVAAKPKKTTLGSNCLIQFVGKRGAMMNDDSLPNACFIHKLFDIFIIIDNLRRYWDTNLFEEKDSKNLPNVKAEVRHDAAAILKK